ncbi:CoA transferase [Microbacterium sp. LS_15]|uniref:CoA transferase n=1 Tax=Microbacterium sp. LS_15 TaxID=3055790 RepID=UPI0035C1618B
MSSRSSSAAASALLERVWADLGIRPLGADDHLDAAGEVPLRSRLATAELAWSSVRALGLLTGIRTRPDPRRIAMAYRSDRVLTIDGTAPTVWAPLSGFWQTADGWIRTHANYPHHAAALRSALAVRHESSADALEEAVRDRTADDVVDAILAAGGLAVRVRSEQPAVDDELRRSPLLQMQRTLDRSTVNATAITTAAGPTGAGARPLDGIRVLDLTRVIAGPVCTRSLALLGADVLRLDPPHLPEPEWQHFDTGQGKRSALLDARTEHFRELLDHADVVVLGYRPSSLARLGLLPADLLARHPSLIVAELSAWGRDQPDRAGFDSLVQAESGIAEVESPDDIRPGVLPAQALDHSAGYLLAASIVAALRHRKATGGGWHISTSLRRVAAELLTLPRRHEPQPMGEFDTAPHVAAFDIDGLRLTTARPALPGVEFAPPRRWGRDQPRW